MAFKTIFNKSIKVKSNIILYAYKYFKYFKNIFLLKLFINQYINTQCKLRNFLYIYLNKL